ncbi:MAG: SIMPL domain-containing protein [Oleispira sp.]|nr:SIMPL domain-containing protein [Oleispira sp.]MBL4880348.1 SIMPL domain-containing protein [Oleispira sp.]
MKKIIPIILLAFASSGAVANPELKGTPEELRRFLHPSDRIVSIYAQSEQKAYSDKAIISLVITTEDQKLSASLSKNSELRASITKQFVAAGIDLENIKSSKFSTSPQYGWFGKKPSSYKVVNRMAVTITEENQLKEIASVADNYEQVELLDTAFEHSQKEMTEEMVNQQALAKVMKQKEFYEKSLGIKLVPVGFRKSNIGYGATQGAMALESAVVTSRNKSSSYQESPARYESSAKSSFDEVKYEAGIYVDFKIESEAL